MSYRLCWGLIVLTLLLLLCPFARAGTPVPFDRVYTVAGPGSTTPLSQFDVNGPAPWIYLDLPPAGGQYSYGSSNWFAGSR